MSGSVVLGVAVVDGAMVVVLPVSSDVSPSLDSVPSLDSPDSLDTVVWLSAASAIAPSVGSVADGSSEPQEAARRASAALSASARGRRRRAGVMTDNLTKRAPLRHDTVCR